MDSAPRILLHFVIVNDQVSLAFLRISTEQFLISENLASYLNERTNMPVGFFITTIESQVKSKTFTHNSLSLSLSINCCKSSQLYTADKEKLVSNGGNPFQNVDMPNAIIWAVDRRGLLWKKSFGREKGEKLQWNGLPEETFPEKPHNDNDDDDAHAYSSLLKHAYQFIGWFWHVWLCIIVFNFKWMNSFRVG